jgi:putative ABC transport system substrate-binding protein
MSPEDRAHASARDFAFDFVRPEGAFQQRTSRRLFGLGFGGLGQRDGQHSVFVNGFDLVADHGLRETDLALKPAVIVVGSTAGILAARKVTRITPLIWFGSVDDPVALGLVESFARPGGNATGFAQFEFGIGGKWLELLKELAPGLKRAGVIRDPGIAAGMGQFGAIQSVAPSLGIEVTPLSVRDPGEIERVITAFARTENGGLVVTGSALAVVHRDLIIGLAAKHKLPAVYFADYLVRSGGLASYGPDLVDQFRQAASYVDRILKGEKPADLPVQTPTKYETAINLKTAKALGLTVPTTLLARADEVIE